MTRMTRPDCAVMRNLINTHTHTHMVLHCIVLYTNKLLGGCRFPCLLFLCDIPAWRLMELYSILLVDFSPTFYCLHKPLLFLYGSFDSTINSTFARLGTDYEIRNQWFFAIMEAMTTD